jgi:hypothetical protein
MDIIRKSTANLLPFQRMFQWLLAQMSLRARSVGEKPIGLHILHFPFSTTQIKILTAKVKQVLRNVRAELQVPSLMLLPLQYLTIAISSHDSVVLFPGSKCHV